MNKHENKNQYYHSNFKLTLMNIRKLLQLAVCLLMATSINAQTLTTDWGWDWADTSKVPASLMPQQVEFLNNRYPYPAKPRNMWEIGISVGKAQIFGDVTNYGFGYGGALTFRKA